VEFGQFFVTSRRILWTGHRNWQTKFVENCGC